MTQQTTTPRRSPLRGLFFGLIVAMFLFPGFRHMIFHTIIGIICAAVGAVIAVTVLSLSTVRQ